MKIWLRSLCLSTLLLAVPATLVAENEPIIAPNEGLPLIDWTDAEKAIGQNVIVQGEIVATGRSNSITFLNFDNARSFTAIVRKGNYDKFPKAPDVMYGKRIVQIRGRISTFRGKPQIEISTPDQVTVVEKAAETGPIEALAKRPARKFTGRARVATYNVLNLFDDEDCPYHNDEGTSPKPRSELENLAATIKQVDADVIALQEVENRFYLERFNEVMLADMGYEHVVCFEGNDGRGIDVAVLSRFPVGPVTSYRHLRWQDERGRSTGFRRDLLRVRIEPPNARAFDVFTVHLKSKSSGGDTESVRMGEVTAIRNIVEAMLADDPDALFVVCGDFNDTWDSKPIKLMRGEGMSALNAFVADAPEGCETYNRGQYRSMIDYIFCSPAMAKCYVKKSFAVIPGSIESSGSDHNPVMMDFDLGAAEANKKSAVSASPTGADAKKS